MSTSVLRKLFVILGAVVAAVSWTGTAAAAPINDNFAQATPITALPFSDTADLSYATTEPGEPQNCYFSSQTAWYSYTTPTEKVVEVDPTGGTAFYPEVNVYRANGSDISSLSFVRCANFGQKATFTAQAGATYYFQTESLFGYFGTVQLRVREILPPPNDDFANATPVTSVPYSDSQSAVAATKESGEPNPSCAPSPPSNSWWYAFTPTNTDSYQVSLGSGTWSTEAVYTGTSLTDLTQIACRSQGGASTAFRGIAGTTYYIQVSDVYGGQYGLITLNLAVAPPPNAGFNYFPSDPSVFDTIQFWGQSNDPAGNGIDSELYDFGDGTTAVGCCPAVIGYPPDATHQYASDGDYTATVTAKTPDGRTATYSTTIHVRTHDVAIDKFLVPRTARAGQLRSISVGISNHHYTESVRVELFKSVSGGDFVSVGVLTHDALVLGAGRTTPYTFNYVFTNADATLGKVTFKALATIVGARDAQPADNTAISLPTIVTS
jgi:PKD domain